MCLRQGEGELKEERWEVSQLQKSKMDTHMQLISHCVLSGIGSPDPSGTLRNFGGDFSRQLARPFHDTTKLKS